MKKFRVSVFLVSGCIAILALGAGFFTRVAAEDSSYRQVVLFSEVLSLVLDNYVDPVEPDHLLEGAYEGMLRGLDPHAAYLTPVELTAWKEKGQDLSAGPGVTVLKGYGALQVVEVDPGSPAEQAGFRPGDQIRSIDGRLLRDDSLDQSLRRLRGPAGSSVTLERVRPSEGFEREKISVVRAVRGGDPYDLDSEDGVVVLKLRDPGRIALDALVSDLDDYRSRGIDRLLIDLRNVAEGNPGDIQDFTGLFFDGYAYRLVDREDRPVRNVETGGSKRAWKGEIGLLVNGATAGAAEGFARLLQVQETARVYGEKTYGMAAEPKLFELNNGAGVLVSARMWELGSGETWNETGVEPDVEIRPEGATYEERLRDQRRKALEAMTSDREQKENVG